MLLAVEPLNHMPNVVHLERGACLMLWSKTMRTPCTLRNLLRPTLPTPRNRYENLQAEDVEGLRAQCEALRGAADEADRLRSDIDGLAATLEELQPLAREAEGLRRQVCWGRAMACKGAVAGRGGEE